MLMKSLFVCCAALAAVIVQAGWGSTDFIHGRCDREIPVYGPGERMTFTFDVRHVEGTRTLQTGRAAARRTVRADWMTPSATTWSGKNGFCRA